MQEFLFNINIPTRVGFQTPFTNITMDLLSRVYENEPVVWGGEILDEVYDYQHEMNILNQRC